MGIKWRRAGIKCSEEHPLVLFLDDLQWADCISLNLIPLIVSGDVRLTVPLLRIHNSDFKFSKPTIFKADEPSLILGMRGGDLQQAFAVGGSVQK